MFAWSLDSRAKALKRQQRKQNKLIHKMLPKVVVEKLKSGQDVIETFDSASIFFSSVVAFKDITRACTAFQVRNQAVQPESGFLKHLRPC